MTPDIEPGSTRAKAGAQVPSLSEDRIKDLFFDLSGLPLDQRAAVLEERCGHDIKLLQDLQILLAAHDEAGRFLAGATQQMPSDDLSLSPLVGRYKLLQKIGEGGFGTVYMAEQQHPVRRRVALKIIKAGMDSQQVIARFEAERQALAMMDHPNIARVLDAGATEAGRPYFVMELVDGIPITRYCDEQQLELRERLHLFIAVCNGLQHAHQKGIIHRDIKPSNILVMTYDAKPVPKLIDFGIAKALHQKLTEGTLFTQFGAAVGTLEYMSPEQTQRDAVGTDTRSDIYSLGVVLYELLTGSTPLESRTLRDVAYADVLRMIRETEPPKPSTRIAHTGDALALISASRRTDSATLKMLVAGDLDWIVMKALEKDRARRYASASDLARDIERYLADEPVDACPPSASYRFGKFARRHRAALRLAVAALLLLVVTTAFSIWEALQANKAKNLANTRLERQVEAQNATGEQLRLTIAAESQAMHRLFDARFAQAKASRLSRRVGQRFDSLDAIAEATRIAAKLKLPPDSVRELRNVAIACLALPDMRLGRKWPGWPAGTSRIDFDGDLAHYARTDNQGVVSIRNVAGDAEIAQFPTSKFESGPRFSSNGKYVAMWAADLNLWKLGGHEPVRVMHREPGQFFGIDFSANGKEFAVGDANGCITLYDLVHDNPPRQLQSGHRAICMAIHPQKRQIAVACDGAVEIRDLDTGKVIASLPIRFRLNWLDWNPDGRTLGVACHNDRIYLWDVESGKTPLVLEGLSNGGIVIAFNHSGNLLVSSGWEGLLRLWDPRTGKQIFSTQGGLPVAIPRFSFDDHTLAGDMRDGKLGLWEVAACWGEYRTLLRNPSEGKAIYEGPSVDKQGRLLAVGMQDGLCLWDLQNGSEAESVVLPGCDNVCFEPSGALLTNGSAGLLRWPVRELATGLLQIGPPTKLPVPGRICHIACSGDGAVIAVSNFQGGCLLRAEQPDKPLPLESHADARYVALSRDGRWVATGSHTRTQVKISNARNGKLEKELSVGGSEVDFSPDGKWLATTSGGLHLWSTQSWEMVREIGGRCCAFSPDSKILAAETGYGVIRLLDPVTGNEYAQLEDPHQDRARFLRFTEDGTQLIATNDDSQSIHVWDLRKIRAELVPMDLDWELPAYPPASQDSAKPFRLHVELGDLNAMIKRK